MLFLYAYSLWQTLSLQMTAEHFTTEEPASEVIFKYKAWQRIYFQNHQLSPTLYDKITLRETFFIIIVTDLEAKCLDFLQMVVSRA